MSVRPGCEIKAGLARHDHMHFMMLGCDGELVGRIQGRLRRNELPGANPGVRGSRLNRGKQ
jgi:hypothetical protein